MFKKIDKVRLEKAQLLGKIPSRWKEKATQTTFFSA